jgi:23S rRNA (pseudouridine1915-N3)-methyltransferase
VKFLLVVVGKSKFPFVDAGLAHYWENIRHFAELECLEVKDSGGDPEREAETLLEALKKRKILQDGKSRVFLLDERGKIPSSPELAAQIGALRDQGVQRFVFVIGGPYGFTEELRKQFSLISLSRLTFPHDLVRLILSEQIYRALHILTGGKYHHGG